MASLADVPDLVGFFSYSREDDEGSGGRLSKLRERIQEELRGQLGRTKRDFRLWQDKTAIAHGELWEDRIKTAIAESAFFIPIITPTAVRSYHCKFEFDSFLAREKELGRSNLVFPILYIPVPALTDDRWRQDPLLAIIGSRQYEEWQNLRHLDASSTEVAQRVEKFCANICRALQQEWLSPEERQRTEARRVAEAERRRQQEAEIKQRADEEERRRKAEADERRRDEQERRRQEAEDRRRLAEAEAEKRRREEEQRRSEGARPVRKQWPFLANAAARSIAPGRWRMAAGSAMALLLVGWIGLYQMGVPVWVPWTPRAEQPGAPGADKAKAAAEAEATLKAARCPSGDSGLIWGGPQSVQPLDCEQQQLKAEEQRQAKAAAEAEAGAKAEQAERQALAAAKAEEERKATAAAEAEAKQAEQQRLAALRAEQERNAKSAAPAVTKGPFEIQSNMEATGRFVDYIGYPQSVRSVGECEQKCTQSAGCNAFAFDKRPWQPGAATRGFGLCYLYSRAELRSNSNFDSGIREATGLAAVRAEASKVLGSTEVQWKQIFDKDGKTYRTPELILYRGTQQASCGEVAQSAMGPFYCPADQKVYLDASFFDQIATRCDVGSRTCQFSQAYVIAHEVGHHVQNLLGILPKAQQAQRAADSKAAANHIQVQVELQADCLAGVWANRENEYLRSQDKPPIIDAGDVEAALRAAAAIGDDTLQRRALVNVVPDSFTHGSAEQRQRWFNNGFRSGSLASCNTFGAAQL